MACTFWLWLSYYTMPKGGTKAAKLGSVFREGFTVGCLCEVSLAVRSAYCALYFVVIV